MEGRKKVLWFNDGIATGRTNGRKADGARYSWSCSGKVLIFLSRARWLLITQSFSEYERLFHSFTFD